MDMLGEFKLVAGVFLLLSGCGGGDSTENQESVDISGAVQKGPFVIGSVVSINELSATGAATNATLTTQTKDDLGNFTFSYSENSLLQINASGYYRNEITGELSNGILNLSSIVQITDSENQSAHVNILTHLISSRVLKLIAEGNSHEDAISSATQELISILDDVVMSPSVDLFSDLSLYSDDSSNESNAYLAVISALFYKNSLDLAEKNETNPDAELTLILNSLSSDISDGVLNDIAIIESLNNAIPSINPQSVKTHLADIASLAGSSSEPANINLFLDSDLDGIYNEYDLDDDGDEIPDTEDADPYRANFVVNDIVLNTTEDTNLEITLDFNNPSEGEVEYVITRALLNGVLFGTFPDVTYQPNLNFNGADTVKLYLSQEDMRSDEILITINVHSENDEPIISGAPATNIKAYSEYSFTPVVSDADNANLEFTIKNRPNWLEFSTTTGELIGTPSNDDAGDYPDITLTVSDGITEVSLASFDLTVEYSIWATQTNIPMTVQYHATAEVDGVVYLFGGLDSSYFPTSKVFAFYPDTNSWETKTPMSADVFEITAHNVNGLIYVFSGHSGPAGYANLVQIYNPSTDSWTNGTPMPTTRRFFTSSVVDGNIYVIGGGNDEDRYISNVESYDPITDQWTSKSELPDVCGENYASASTLGGKIYYVGGRCGTGTNSAVHIFDPLTDQWTAGTPMNHKRYGLSTSVINGKLYAMGGYASPSYLDVIEVYDPVIDEWDTKTKMGVPRRHFSSVTLNDKIYVFGGDGGTGEYSVNSVEMYDPNLE